MKKLISTGKLHPRKFEKASADIDKLKRENNNLYHIIENILPQRRFDDKGKTFFF
jgi:hypothetical protein